MSKLLFVPNDGATVEDNWLVVLVHGHPRDLSHVSEMRSAPVVHLHGVRNSVIEILIGRIELGYDPLPLFEPPRDRSPST